MGVKIIEILFESILLLFVKEVVLFVCFKDVDVLLKDNKNDYIIIKEFFVGVGSFVLRCGWMFVVVNVMLIVIKYIDFIVVKLIEVELVLVIVGFIEWLVFFINN